ncbi:hypothetical protein TWF192_005752 [Orbilia oligospora]|uniref:Uncharacterized protein n=1 Tax=Orbilia oligospora TaxID=2813651 RepID=A0A6G1MM08_ORBOL|nr:hypothetical protein TWF191_003888 [Orbilia oligospora]KAF3263471.1 hypothetical protein TWF192_005752 [Orbilia oligospora]
MSGNPNTAVMSVYNDKLLQNYQNLRARATGRGKNTDYIDLESVSRLYREAVIENDRLKQEVQRLYKLQRNLERDNVRILQALKKAEENEQRLKASYQAMFNTNLALHNSTLCLSTQLNAIQSQSDREPGSQPSNYIEISPISQAPTPLLPAAAESTRSSPASVPPRCSISMLDNPLVEDP